MAEAVRRTTFEGAGGAIVTLDERGDRVASYKVMNYVRLDNKMSSVLIGMYNSTEHQYTSLERAVVWPGNSTLVPRNRVAGATLDISKGVSGLAQRVLLRHVLRLQLRS